MDDIQSIIMAVLAEISTFFTNFWNTTSWVWDNTPQDIKAGTKTVLTFAAVAFVAKPLIRNFIWKPFKWFVWTPFDWLAWSPILYPLVGKPLARGFRKTVITPLHNKARYFQQKLVALRADLKHGLGMLVRSPIAGPVALYKYVSACKAKREEANKFFKERQARLIGEQVARRQQEEEYDELQRTRQMVRLILGEMESTKNDLRRRNGPLINEIKATIENYSSCGRS